MGYDLHITRAEDWQRNQGHEISSDEWASRIKSDPQLAPDPENGPHAVLWTAHPDGRKDAWLDWARGNIYTTNPDRALFRKMLKIARELEAWIQGDGKEVYDSVEDFVQWEEGFRPSGRE